MNYPEIQDSSTVSKIERVEKMGIVDERCIHCGSKIEGGYCDCFPTTDIKVSMPPVKEPKKSVGSVTVDVEVNGLDEALKKAEELKKLYTEIDLLQRRIIAGAERVEQIANRCCRAQEELGGRPAQSYMEYMENKKI